MSDGWGDASGIEGNYEDETTEEKSTEPTESTPPSETTAPTETSETNATNEVNETKTNIKQEWNGRTIYIPDSVLHNMEDTYLESQLKLRKAGFSEFKKNRHFYPLLVQFGLEALSDANADDIRTRLSELSDS
jgi:hypothetical protein